MTSEELKRHRIIQNTYHEWIDKTLSQTGGEGDISPNAAFVEGVQFGLSLAVKIFNGAKDV